MQGRRAAAARSEGILRGRSAMEADDLELYSTQQLIHELMRRSTFLGIVVHADDEAKGAWVGEKAFRVHFNENLDAERAGRLLGVVSDYINLSHS
jgi:hypothetical protein